VTLLELQSRFAASLADSHAPDGRMAIYCNTIRINYRNALAATYPVVRALVGNAFFDAAVDAYATTYPSGSGDLNVFGDKFAAFLASYRYARGLPYLPDVARLEWAIDESGRAADAASDPEHLVRSLAGVPTEELGRQRFVLDPSCRFAWSSYPLFKIWRVHQADHEGDMAIDLEQGASHVVVRRSPEGVAVESVPEAELTWLTALGEGASLAAAVDSALAMDSTFDLGRALHARIADGTLVMLAPS
jgi:hypothetical protein